MKTFAVLIAGALAVSTVVASEKVEAKKEPVQMTAAEMEKVVAGYAHNQWCLNASYDCGGYASTDYNRAGNFAKDNLKDKK